MCNIGSVCEAALARMQALHPERAFGLRTSGDLGGAFDGTRLRPLFDHLLDNAVEHGAKDVPVTLEARGEPDEVSVRVADFSLPLEALGMIFHSPLRLSGSCAAPVPAFFAALEVVLEHGGTLTLEAAGRSESTITVRFPRSA